MSDDPPVILCIDDDPDCLAAVRDIVEAVGYRPVTATSAEDGLRIYRREHPDLVIVDLMMEEVDAGTAFVKELKALGNTVPVYMLSSLGDSLSLTTDTAELGLAGVLQKPIDPTTLMALLRTRLEPDAARGTGRPPAGGS